MWIFKAIYRGMCFLEEKLSIILAALMAVIIAIQVFYRYVLNEPLIWTSELARYCLVWLTFLGGSLVLRQKKHISISVFMNRMPEKMNCYSSIVVNIAIVFALAITLYESISFMDMISMVPSVTMEFSMAFVYLALPAGFAFMIIHLAIEIFKQINNIVVKRERRC